MAITTKLSDLIFGTPIHDIEVPEHLNRTVKTGIDYVDSAMGGNGFTPSSVTLFTGEPGSGKTTLPTKRPTRSPGSRRNGCLNTSIAAAEPTPANGPSQSCCGS